MKERSDLAYVVYTSKRYALVIGYVIGKVDVSIEVVYGLL